MIKAPAFVGNEPIRRTVAPPSVELGRLGGELAHAVDPAAGLLHAGEFVAFDWRVRNDTKHLLVAPDIVFERRDIEIADKNGAIARLRAQRRAVAHLVEEAELVGEFRIELRIGDVAAGRDVKIVQRNRIAQPGAFAEFRRDVAAIGLTAERLNVETLKWQPRQHDDAVIALLTIKRGIFIAEPLEALEREFIVRTFGFLQAQYVGTDGLEEARNQIDAQPNRIDVPACNGELHGDRNSGIGNQISGIRNR